MVQKRPTVKELEIDFKNRHPTASRGLGVPGCVLLPLHLMELATLGNGMDAEDWVVLREETFDAIAGRGKRNTFTQVALPQPIFTNEQYCKACGCQLESVENNALVCIEEGCPDALIQSDDIVEEVNGVTFVNGVHSARLAPPRPQRPSDTELNELRSPSRPLQTTDEAAARIERIQQNQNNVPTLPTPKGNGGNGKRRKKKKGRKIDISAMRKRNR